MSWKENGSLVLSMTPTHLFDVKGWVLSGGRGLRILHPPELVAAIKEELHEIMAEYR